MLIRASGAVHPGFYMFTLGDTCRYALGTPDGAWDKSSFLLFDPGASVHWPFLVERLKAHGFSLDELSGVLFTHLHADRIGALPYLRRHCPGAKILGTSSMQQLLNDAAFRKDLYQQDQAWSNQYSLSAVSPSLDQESYCHGLAFDSILGESDLINFTEEVSVRVVSFPGHTIESSGYLILPYGFLIADEGCGYFRGADLAAPGADYSLDESLQALQKLVDFDLGGLCLPCGGMLTGSVVRKHLLAVRQNTIDLKAEVARALGENMSSEQVRQNILTSLYDTASLDPIVRHNMQNSFDMICRQLELA